MTNLETKIKSKEEMERHETQENLEFVKETLSQFPQFKHYTVVIATMAPKSAHDA